MQHKSSVPQLEENSGRKWDSRTLSHEELIALLNNKREAAKKRERAMEYASSYHVKFF